VCIAVRSREKGTLGRLQGLIRVSQRNFQVSQDSISIRLGRTHILDHSGSRSLCTGIGVLGFLQGGPRQDLQVRLVLFVQCIFCSSIDLHKAFKMG
jgi:hypothetical protein